jgi:MerR family transcriptional regulator, copper efflux regulator
MNATTGLVQIGEVADKLRVSTRTIKYYEELGLIKPGERSPGGFRLFREEDVERLKRILKMKGMGFSLTAIREVLAVRDVASDADKVIVLNKVIERLEEQEQQVAERIRNMREEVGHAEELLRELRHDVALCKEHVRELEEMSFRSSARDA